MYQPPPPPAPPLAPPPVRPRGSVPVLVPHLVWEAVLLVLVVGFSVIAAARTPVFQGGGLWWLVATVGLLATGLALSLRTGTPNLAVGGVALLSSALYLVLVADAGMPWPVAAMVALAGSVAVGIGLGLVVGLTSAPAWAVSLGGLALLQGAVLTLFQRGAVIGGDQVPVRSEAAWFGLFVLISLAGGGLWAVPQVRRLLGADRSGTEPVRFRAARLIPAVVGLGVSSGLAGLSGLASVVRLGAVVTPAVLLDLTLLALAAVLVGGVSVFGGRGGVAGTVLGVMLLTVVVEWVGIEWRNLVEDSTGLGRSATWMIVGLALLAGIGVSRALEAIVPARPWSLDGNGEPGPAGFATAVQRSSPGEPPGSPGSPAAPGPAPGPDDRG
ncbi:MAG: ABC transporter permease subunit [Natronosporangium sp.]